LYGNLPPREISMKDVFRSGDSSKKFKIAEGQWYRYAPSYVSPAYHLLEGFLFIQESLSGDLQERVLYCYHDYDQCFLYVHFFHAYHLPEGFPFIQEPPSGELHELVLIRHHDYDQCFQSVQLLQCNSQVKFNVTVYRNLPTTRDSIMTS